MKTFGMRHQVTTYRVLNSGIDASVEFEISLRNTREHFVLRALLSAGATGCTFFSDPAPRWASSIFLLRQRGLAIDTEREAHSGMFPGHHARYILRSQVFPIFPDFVEDAYRGA